MFYIGYHVSSSKGYVGMANQTLDAKGNTFSFFTRNPRGGKAKDLNQKDVLEYLDIADRNQFGAIVAHAPYTMNACAEKEHLRVFAKEMIIDDLERLEYTPNNYYNFHPGSHVGQGADVGIEYISSMLNEILKPEQSTVVLLETMSGKGSEVGGTFEELRQILDRIEYKDRMGVCLDTCHVWDAGYDIVHDLDGVLTEFDHVIGIDKLMAIHLNDSKNEMGSHKDRHEKIGQGTIGLEAIGRIINHEALQNKPFVLETPNDEMGYAEEISLLKKIHKGAD